MKKITWQEPIMLTNFDGSPFPSGEGNPRSFDQFLLDRLTDGSFGATMERVLAAVKMRELVRHHATCATDALELEDADYLLLRAAVETPSAPYNPAVAHAVLPFMRAVTEAK